MFTWGKGCKHTVFFLTQGSRQQAAGSRQQAAGSRQQAAGSRQQAAGSRQQATGSRQQAAGSRQQAAGSRQQAAPPELFAQFVHSDMQPSASGRLVSRRVTRGQIAQSVHSGQGDRAISWP